MKRAIAFAGGGSKGSYQLGAWTALNELGYEFDIATGTSIGSINAGFYVQHDYDTAKEFWEGLSIDKVMVNGFNLDGKLVSIAEDMSSVKPFLKSYLNFKGADITPFIEALHKYADEDKFFASDIDYGIVTVKFPSLTPVIKLKRDIALGTYVDWVNTSCACFPVFPLAVIGSQSYIDGGYYDNLPIGTAFNLGADEVFAVDLRDECYHPSYRKHPFVKYIYPSRSLGSFMCFEHDVMMRNMTCGYRDVYKYFGKYYGKKYTFSLAEDRKEYFELLARRFMLKLSVIETQYRNKTLIFDKTAVNAPCTELLASRLYNGSTQLDYLAAALEICADYLHTDDGVILDMSDFAELVLGVISESGFVFKSSTLENLEEVERMVGFSDRKHIRSSHATEAEILIILAVILTICE